MHVQRFNNLEQLAPYRHRWDELAGDRVFQNWIWLTTWWKHYGQSQANCELAVLLVFDESVTARCHAQQNPSSCSSAHAADQLIAILPCYFQQTLAHGTTLRLLGDGEICSEYLDLLTAEQHSQQAAKTLAEYLVRHANDWDLADFNTVGSNVAALNQLINELQAQDCRVARTAGQSCWSIELPATWDEFLALQSKSHRKQLRRLDNRILKSTQSTWHLVQNVEQFEQAWPILVDLHQRRRISLNEPGCFASKHWAAFNYDVAQQLLATEQLRLSWLELAGKPIAAEYYFANKNTTFAYQGGLDPDRISAEPGRLSMIRTIQHAIEEGHTSFDLLRGDEPYKPHWRAKPNTAFDVQIVPARNAARLRFQMTNYFRHAGRLARQVTNLLS